MLVVIGNFNCQRLLLLIIAQHSPLMMSDDALLAVYHTACAAAPVTEILVDLYTFFHPPAPSAPLYVLTTEPLVPYP
jgi:hypothetical protein